MLNGRVVSLEDILAGVLIADISILFGTMKRTIGVLPSIAE